MTIENAMLIVLPRSRAGPRPQTRLKKLRENAKPDPQYVRPRSQQTAGRRRRDCGAGAQALDREHNRNTTPFEWLRKSCWFRELDGGGGGIWNRMGPLR